MEIVNIKDLIDMGSEEYDLELDNKISTNSKYKESQKKYLDLINSLEAQMRFDIDNAVTFMETIAVDTAFNEGFKLAIRLILSSL